MHPTDAPRGSKKHDELIINTHIPKVRSRGASPRLNRPPHPQPPYQCASDCTLQAAARCHGADGSGEGFGGGGGGSEGSAYGSEDSGGEGGGGGDGGEGWADGGEGGGMHAASRPPARDASCGLSLVACVSSPDPRLLGRVQTGSVPPPTRRVLPRQGGALAERRECAHNPPALCALASRKSAPG